MWLLLGCADEELLDREDAGLWSRFSIAARRSDIDSSPEDGRGPPEEAVVTTRGAGGVMAFIVVATELAVDIGWLPSSVGIPGRGANSKLMEREGLIRKSSKWLHYLEQCVCNCMRIAIMQVVGIVTWSIHRLTLFNCIKLHLVRSVHVQ